MEDEMGRALARKEDIKMHTHF